MKKEIQDNNHVKNLLDIVKPLSVYKPSHIYFLINHVDHLSRVFENTHMWRTDTQKRSIINDIHFPTSHSKFHQAILEQKVQFDQSIYLAKDFELKKLEIEELELEIEELGTDRKSEIRKNKLNIEIAFKRYELANMQIAMEYRMREVQGWQVIIDKLLEDLKDLPEEAIWKKDHGEITAMFFSSLNNLQNLNKSTDSGERSNLIALASYAVKHVYEIGKLDQLESECNIQQHDSLNFVKEILKINGNRDH